MQAIILAAGCGRRLAPLTDHTPKALLEVGGRPIIWRVIVDLIAAGIKDIIVVTSGYYLDVAAYAWSGVKYREVVQPVPLGTADALAQVGSMPEPFLVLGCDALFPVAHLQAVMAEPAEIVLSVRPEAEVHHSTITYYKGGKIAGIAEKPTFPTSTTQSLFLYKLPAAVFDYLPQVRKSRRKEYELQDAVNMMVGDGASVTEVECAGDYFHLTGVGDLEMVKPEMGRRDR